MFTPTLIRVAILAYFAASSGHGIKFDLHAGKKVATKAEEKVVLVDRPFCEKCAVRSDVPALLPKYSITSNWNLDHVISNFDAMCKFMARYPFLSFQGPIGQVPPADETLSQQFDTLLSKVSPTEIKEPNCVGEIIAKKLHLYAQASGSEFEESTDLGLGTNRISAALGLNMRISKLTLGWQKTFQLPFAWDHGNLQITHRNESSPPIEEIKSYPDMSPRFIYGEDCQVFSMFTSFRP